MDTLDNDGDTLIDYTVDPGCNHPLDDTETHDCSDGVDNDRDGSTDSSDTGCVDASDPSERHPSLPCDDGLDNDLDRRVDFLPSGALPFGNYGDRGCQTSLSPSERPQCQDGIDNDGDGVIDFDGGASLDLTPADGTIDLVYNATTPPVAALDPQCSGAPYRGSEAVEEVPGPSGAARLGLFGILLASGIAATSAARRRSRPRQLRLGAS
jgi:hypothetical protein